MKWKSWGGGGLQSGLQRQKKLQAGWSNVNSGRQSPEGPAPKLTYRFKITFYNFISLPICSSFFGVILRCNLHDANVHIQVLTHSTNAELICEIMLWLHPFLYILVIFSNNLLLISLHYLRWCISTVWAAGPVASVGGWVSPVIIHTTGRREGAGRPGGLRCHPGRPQLWQLFFRYV